MVLKLWREILPENASLKDSHVTDFYAQVDYHGEQEQGERRGGPCWDPRNNTSEVRQSQSMNEGEEHK